MGRAQILKAELDNDPLARGYAGMTDTEAAASLNLVNRAVDRKAITPADFMASIDYDEWAAGTRTRQASDYLQLLLASEQLDLSATQVKRALVNSAVGIFGGGYPNTRAALVALGRSTVSRARELGLRSVRPGTVGEARRL